LYYIGKFIFLEISKSSSVDNDNSDADKTYYNHLKENTTDLL